MSAESELPASWATARLDEVCIINARGFTPFVSGGDQPVAFVPMAAVVEEFGGIDVSATRPLGEVIKGYTAFVEGDVLFAKITPCMENGKVAVVPPLATHIGFGSTEFHVLRSAGAVEPKWVGYHLSQLQFRRAARQDMTGSAGQLRVQSNWLAGACIPVAPIAEQRRVIQRVDELFSDLDAGVLELVTAKRKLQQYRQSLLKAAVEGALTAEWRARNPPQETGAELLARILRERRARWEARQLGRFAKLGKKPVKDWREMWPVPASPRCANLCDLPVGWCWASLEQVAADEPYSLSIGPFGSNLKVEDYRSAGVPLVFVRNIRSRRYGGESTRFVTEAKANELAAHSVSAGDVLITKMGEPPGDADVYPADQPLAVITADCIKVRCQHGLVLPEYLAAVINSEIGKSQIQPMTQGVAQKKVSLGRFSKLAVPLPSMAEQAQILLVLLAQRGVAAALEAELVQSLRLATAQRQNILRAAFAGQLVPQDPADEAASALLARLRADREAVARPPQPSRRTKTKASA